MEKIIVKEATIPEAGMGVFAAEDLPVNTTLGEYQGEVLNARELEARYPTPIFEAWLQKPETKTFFQNVKQKKPTPNPPLPDYGNGMMDFYVLQISKDKFIDAIDPQKSNWTRYINHPFRTLKKKANVRFTRTGKIVTTKKIKRGEEIFVSYGKSYFVNCPFIPL